MRTMTFNIRMTTSQLLIATLLSALSLHTATAGQTPPPPAKLSAVEIVEKHVAARGGLAAWRSVQTIAVTGKIEAGRGDSIARSERAARSGRHGATPRPAGASAAAMAEKTDTPQAQLPFRLEMKRPQKSRLEVDFAGRTAVQIYDGHNGWKFRPYLNRTDIEPFTAEESQSETDRDMDGPLIDYQAKGIKIELEGVDQVEQHPAYKLKTTTRQGTVQHVWIDTQSFLDVKIEGIPRRLDNRTRTVWVYQRDFRAVNGLKVPFIYETVIEGGREPHRMLIDSVVVDGPLDDSRFAKPVALAASPTSAPIKNSAQLQTSTQSQTSTQIPTSSPGQTSALNPSSAPVAFQPATALTPPKK
jgi:hypothetical protein